MRHFSGVMILGAALLCLAVQPVRADGQIESNVQQLLQSKDLTQLRVLAQSNNENVDPIVRGLLSMTERRLTADPDYAQRMLSVAGEFAPSITPPTVAPVCAELRRIVEALPEKQYGTELHTTIVTTTQSFASSPVVVEAGQPNLCEDSWIQASNLTGEPLLFMNPSMRSPGLPPVTIAPTVPSGRNKASSD
ncbi:MAG: hypothetical protein AB7S81_05335 [Bdellovibrionales bacterium]